MSLTSWQSAVVELVSHAAAPSERHPDLDPRERQWLEMAAEHPGTAVTRDVVRSWRWQRVGRSVPLTLLALRRCGLLESTRVGYLASTFAPSSYAHAEGRQFLAFLDDGRHDPADGAPGHPDRVHLATIIELERAVLTARASTWTTNIRASRPDDAVVPGVGGLVRAGCDVRELLRGLLAGTAMPAPGSGHGAFLVAPGIAGCFREATAGEIRALTLVGPGCEVAEVAGLWPNDQIDVVTLTRLEAIGALVREPPRPGVDRSDRLAVAGRP